MNNLQGLTIDQTKEFEMKESIKDAKKRAKAAEREAKKAALGVERLRSMEQALKEAEEAEQANRAKLQITLGNRQQEVSDLYLSAEQQADKEIESLHDFYTAKLGNDGKMEFKINSVKLIKRLREIGIYRYDQPRGGMEYVLIQDNKIRILPDKEKIIDIFEDYIRKLPDRKVLLSMNTYNGQVQVEKIIYPDLLMQKLYDNIAYYFSNTLPRLRPVEDSKVKEISIVHDTLRSKYMFYRNCILRITKDGIETIKYKDLQKRLKELGEDNGQYIWENNIIDRNYNPNAGDSGDYEMFINYICGFSFLYYDKQYNERYCDNITPEMVNNAQKRKRCLMSILGYLMHDNYECNLKAVLFTDAVQDQGHESGGTGKGLLGKGLKCVMNRNPDIDVKYLAIPGKNMDETKDTRYGLGDITTQLIHIEDVRETLNLKQLYNDVTDGATFRKLHHDPIIHMCKFMLSANTPFGMLGSTVRRRMIIFELENFFNAERTPEDIFGHQFFMSEWSKYDWEQFDSFMVKCCHIYMQDGLLDDGEINYTDNFLKKELRPEFKTWFEEKIKKGYVEMQKTTYPLEGMWKEFITMKNGQYSDIFKVRNGFTKAIKLWLSVKRVPSGILRSTEDVLIIYPDKNDKLSEVIHR